MCWMSSSGTKSTSDDSSTYEFSPSESLYSDSDHEVVCRLHTGYKILHLPEHPWQHFHMRGGELI